jgi:hypothetical protein
VEYLKRCRWTLKFKQQTVTAHEIDFTPFSFQIKDKLVTGVGNLFYLGTDGLYCRGETAGIRALQAKSVAQKLLNIITSGVPRNFVRGRGSTNSVEERGQRERGSGGGSPLVSGSGGSCSFVKEIAFHTVKFS